MADYNQNIKVTADTKQAEKELSLLEKQLQRIQKGRIEFATDSLEKGVKFARRND